MKFAVLVAGIFLAGCAEIGLVPGGLPPPSDPRPVLRVERYPSPTFGAGLIGHRRVDGVRLQVFVVGEGAVRGNLLSEFKSARSQLKPPILAYLIRHPKEGPILFGTGLPEDLGGLGAARLKGAALSPLKVSPGGDIVSRLERASIKVEDIRWVILPDLAPEWAGRAGEFPNASILVSEKAWSNTKRRALEVDLPDPHAFVPEERLKKIDFIAEKPYGAFEHGKDLFGDGTMVLVDLEGGAAGGMGLWVNLDSGPVLLTGPAAFVYDNVFDDALPDSKFVVDISSFSWNTRAMKIMKESVPSLLILPAHDLSSLKMSPRLDVVFTP